MKTIQFRKNIKKTRHVNHESTGMNIVATIGSVEQLRHPEFWN